MPASSDFKELLKSFNERQVKYLIVGAYAVMKYTEPRYTKDLDLWIEPTPENAERVFAALSEFGAPLNEVSVQDFTNQDLIFQIGIEPNRIDIIMSIKGVEFKDAWPQRIEALFEEVPVPLISKSDLLAAKRALARPQDLIDAEQLELSQKVENRIK